MSNFDYDVLAPLMADENIIAIYVNNVQHIYIWHNWDYIKPAAVQFTDAAHLARFAQSMAAAGGSKLDSNSPIAEVRMPDGSRARLFGAPVATEGAVIHITKPVNEQLTMAKLVEIGASSAGAANFLTACVKSWMNIAVVGGFNSGKEGFLSVLVDELPTQARMAVIQPISMLSIKHPDAFILETRKADVNSVGAITNRHLLEPALELLPHRIVLAELDGTEGEVLLNALDVGFSAMFAMTGSGARDALTRLELSAASANLSTPLLTIREKLARTVDIIVHAELYDPSKIALKRIVGIAEVRGMKGDNIDVVQLFERPRDRDELLALGEVSQKLDRIRKLGRAEVDESWFTKTI